MSRLKNIIFKKLYKDLSSVEIIPYKESIWLIDRKKGYWYFEFETDRGKLWWRYSFFSDFFQLFSMEPDEFEPFISEWVEEVLNYKVTTPGFSTSNYVLMVGEVLNYKVTTPLELRINTRKEVEEVLNYKVITPDSDIQSHPSKVEEVLNYKVTTPNGVELKTSNSVEEILNYKVIESRWHSCRVDEVEEIMNYKVESQFSFKLPRDMTVSEVLDYEVVYCQSDHGVIGFPVEDVLQHRVQITEHYENQSFDTDMILRDTSNEPL